MKAIEITTSPKSMREPKKYMMYFSTPVFKKGDAARYASIESKKMQIKVRHWKNLEDVMLPIP